MQCLGLQYFTFRYLSLSKIQFENVIIGNIQRNTKKNKISAVDHQLISPWHSIVVMVGLSTGKLARVSKKQE